MDELFFDKYYAHRFAQEQFNLPKYQNEDLQEIVSVTCRSKQCFPCNKVQIGSKFTML